MDYKSLFKKLNEQLEKEDKYLTITCGGGFALLINDIRATTDIDAFYEEDDWLIRQILDIGEELKANVNGELWLNSSIQTFNRKPPLEDTVEYARFSHLTVRVVSLEYLLGMKFQSGREKDITDAGILLKKLGLRSPIQVLKEYSGFHLDSSDVIWAFEQAYGEEWVAEYLIENQEEVKRYFR